MVWCGKTGMCVKMSTSQVNAPGVHGRNQNTREQWRLTIGFENSRSKLLLSVKKSDVQINRWSLSLLMVNTSTGVLIRSIAHGQPLTQSSLLILRSELNTSCSCSTPVHKKTIGDVSEMRSIFWASNSQDECLANVRRPGRPDLLDDRIVIVKIVHRPAVVSILLVLINLCFLLRSQSTTATGPLPLFLRIPTLFRTIRRSNEEVADSTSLPWMPRFRSDQIICGEIQKPSVFFTSSWIRFFFSQVSNAPHLGGGSKNDSVGTRP